MRIIKLAEGRIAYIKISVDPVTLKKRVEIHQGQEWLGKRCDKILRAANPKGGKITHNNDYHATAAEPEVTTEQSEFITI